MSGDALPPVCILAGGLGTRLGSLARTTPKALLPVAGEPFVLHQLRLLAAHGAREAVLCVGHLGERVAAQIGDERFGIRLKYSFDGPRPLGTLGAIRRAAPLLGPRFLVLYGDTYLRLDFLAAAHAWRRSGLPAMMTVLHNAGRWDVSNASFDGVRVTAYDKHAPGPALEWIDYGLGGLEVASLAAVPAGASDLAELYQALAARGELFGFAATRRFYEIGTPDALAETDRFLAGSTRAGSPSYGRA